MTTERQKREKTSTRQFTLRPFLNHKLQLVRYNLKRQFGMKYPC